MTIQKALKVLNQHNIVFDDYFDLLGYDTNECHIKDAIERMKTYITTGY